MYQAVPFSDISLSKTKAILGQPIDISKPKNTNDNEEIHGNARSRFTRSQRRRRSSSSKRTDGEREMMLSQASAFRDFENLFTAFGALEDWKGLADQAKK